MDVANDADYSAFLCTVRACKDDAELPIITGYGCDQSFTKDHEVSLETIIPAKHEEHKVKKKENSLI